ncbi:putative bifunctional diguanylate cyclase/phosphodiesterase [Alteromonas oceanisediminis]|uniref:putative bifunctional diguanylate cyclase/phosphodiesterase n=1 Tax=Alteromonas oceanisediminis TaxID=2836180 RepID=UPI001BD99849|nr:bifunctional diguanylate cyclase/phosphodiesterase [Alteromonas oceanisediminis]MBT0586759.1 EAL domain-containing protein [Alteromonas oceanisediminis]
MTKRLSIAQKLVIVLISLLIVFSIALSSLLINGANQELTNQQQRIQSQYYKQYQLFNNFISERITGYIESFAGDVYDGESSSIQQDLFDRFDMLQMRWQVDNIWLVEDTGDVSFETAVLPTSAQTFFKNNVSQLQRPTGRVFCLPRCAHFLGVPVMTNQAGQTAIIGVEYPLSELLATFAMSADARVAVVSVKERSEADTQALLHIEGVLTASNLQRFTALIESIPASLDMQSLYQYGHVVTTDDEALLLNLIPVSQQFNNNRYILTVTDISERYFALRNYYVVVISGAVLLSGCFILLVVLLLRSYRRKLENLTERLPLLAENRFDEFRELSMPKSIWFEDELDQLEHAAESLGRNLEKLNRQSHQDQVQLEKMAMFDALTGLPNRSMLMFQLDKHIALLKRAEGAVAFMFMDIDDFKRINDTHGHSIGDRLLKKVAKRITFQLRETDIAARFGGDEYGILLPDIAEQKDAEQVAEKIIESFTRPFEVKEFTFFINVSIGVALTDHVDITAAELLRHADIAMYEAKSVSQSAFKTYDSAMNSKLQRRVELENEARVALKEDQFYLALQPKVDLRSGTLVGFEALIRWNHPEKGAVSPAEFIPVLEKTSLMMQLDYWVIARSMSLLAELSLNGYNDIGMAINVSAKQFLDNNLVDYLEQQLRHYNLAPERIELELTETSLVEDLARACEVMNEVRALGCRIAIDDFGTGYSSLSYLKAMPADVVKIDQSFVSGMLDDQSDRNIVFSAISMVKGLGVTVVAEGIESYAQYELLCHFECHLGQGYFISRPISEKDLWQTLLENCHDGVWKISNVS